MPFSNEYVPAMVSNWNFVVLSLAAVGAAGLSVGVLYRAGAAIALTAFMAVTGVVLGYHQGLKLWHIAAYTVGLLVVLQAGYLIGASFSESRHALFAALARTYRRCREYMCNAHCADAMVCISNCDKITPGMLMAAMRLNIPAIFVSDGPMEAGKVILEDGSAKKAD